MYPSPTHTAIHEYPNTPPRNRPRERNILLHDTAQLAVAKICSRKTPRMTKLQISHSIDIYLPIVYLFVYHRCRKTVYLRCFNDRTLTAFFELLQQTVLKIEKTYSFIYLLVIIQSDSCARSDRKKN